MEQAIGLTPFEIALIASVLLSLMLALRSLGSLIRRSSSTISHVIVAALALGALAILILLYWPSVSGFMTVALSRPAAIASIAAIAFVALALADFLVSRLVAAIANIASRVSIPRGSALAAAAITVVVPVIAIELLLLSYIERSESHTQGRDRIVVQYDLPGAPMDIALVDDRHGYISLGQGSIVRFSIPSDLNGPADFDTVWDGLAYPRGIALTGGLLYVGELGPLPCPEPFPTCKGEDVPGAVDRIAGERQILQQSDGRILAFPVEASGGLAEPLVVLSGLPVVNSQHGVNGMTVAQNGDVVVAIGNIDRDWHDAVTTAAVASNPDFLGTITRISTRSSEIVARGLRNVYDLAYDPKGRLWGIDNDGLTIAGWRAEEVLQIVEGGYYGYPNEGTFSDQTSRQRPVWVLPTVGTAGVAWYSDPTQGEGLAIGSCGQINFLAVAETSSGPTVGATEDVVMFSDVVSVDGCVSSLVTLSDGTLMAGVFGYGGRSSLLVIDPTR